jgi:hypothetical protein
MKNNKEVLSFRIHPDLLFSVIKAQAGSLHKALGESIQNSIDAGATRIDVTLSEREYQVIDDGRGFVSRKQIDDFFQTFGTPHTEGDAIYGRFRIGRGQGFSFAINTWRTGQFEMVVDIKNKGLDFELAEDLEPFRGCHITGELYDPLLPTDLLATKRALTEMCLYTPVPVYLNGKQISLNVTEQKWDITTDFAFIKLANSPKLAVYNLGILVNNFNSYEFGIGGVVVSRVSLATNFARNDMLRASCSVWKKIRPVLQKAADEKNGRANKNSSASVTEEWRQFRASELMSLCDATFSMNRVRDLFEAALFTDISGRHFSLAKLSQQNNITIGNRTNLDHDRISQMKMAVVLDADIMANRFNTTISEVLDYLLSLHIDDSYWKHWAKPLVSGVKQKLTDLEAFTKCLDSHHDILDAKRLSKAEQCALQCINSISARIAEIRVEQRDGLQQDWQKRRDALRSATREIRAMRSQTADAITDGVRLIFIEKSFLSGSNGPTRGMEWAFDVVSLLTHEYCHDINSGLGHIHDSDFYQSFHNLMCNPTVAVGKIVTELFEIYVKRSGDLLGRLSKKAGRLADKKQIHQTNEEKLSLMLFD